MKNAGIALGKNKLHRPLDQAINLLHSLSLAEKMESDSRAIRLHPLVRDFAQKKVPEIEQLLFRANAAENLRTAYFDYPRLEEELRARGVAEVLDDLQIAINWWGKVDQTLQELRLLHKSLRLLANQLTHDPGQLALRLIGHLKNTDIPDIKKLLIEATECQKGPWFNPTSCSFTPVGGPLIQNFVGHSDRVTALAISSDGKTAVSGSNDHTIKLWDLFSGKSLRTLERHSDPVWSVVISPDGKPVVSGSEDHTIMLWDLSSVESITSFIGESAIYCVAISSCGRVLLAGEDSGHIHFFRLEGRLRDVFKAYYWQCQLLSVARPQSTVLRTPVPQPPKNPY